MRKNIQIFFHFLCFMFLYTTVVYTEETASTALHEHALHEQNQCVAKKKILVISSKGGGGHTAVSHALRGYLEDEYEITVVNLIEDVLYMLDPVRFFTFGVYGGEDFYNLCLQYRWIGVVNRFAGAGSWMFYWRKSAVEKLIYDYVDEVDPDLIISVMPFANDNILEVAKQRKLPFIVVTNDLDTSNYIINLQKPNYKKFFYTLAFDDEGMKQKIKDAKIPVDQIVVTGFPLRRSFFEPKNRHELKKEFRVPSQKSVVMILMGGAGSLASQRYVKSLVKIKIPMHIILCLGRNEKLRHAINKICLPSHITMTVMGFTDRIADLMAISDVLITKPGPGTICEALASNLPVIVDKTASTIWWEEMNIEFVEKHAFGDVLTSINDLNGLLTKYIKNTEYVSILKQNMQKIKKENFSIRINELVHRALSLS